MLQPRVVVRLSLPRYMSIPCRLSLQTTSLSNFELGIPVFHGARQWCACKAVYGLRFGLDMRVPRGVARLSLLGYIMSSPCHWLQHHSSRQIRDIRDVLA